MILLPGIVTQQENGVIPPIPCGTLYGNAFVPIGAAPADVSGQTVSVTGAAAGDYGAATDARPMPTSGIVWVSSKDMAYSGTSLDHAASLVIVGYDGAGDGVGVLYFATDGTNQAAGFFGSPFVYPLTGFTGGTIGVGHDGEIYAYDRGAGAIVKASDINPAFAGAFASAVTLRAGVLIQSSTTVTASVTVVTSQDDMVDLAGIAGTGEDWCGNVIEAAPPSPIVLTSADAVFVEDVEMTQVTALYVFLLYDGDTGNLPTAGTSVSIGVDIGLGMAYQSMTVMSSTSLPGNSVEVALTTDTVVGIDVGDLDTENPVYLDVPVIGDFAESNNFEAPAYLEIDWPSALPFIFYGDENMSVLPSVPEPAPEELLLVSSLNATGVQTLVRPAPPEPQTSWGEPSYMPAANLRFSLNPGETLGFGLTLGVESPLSDGGDASLSVLMAVGGNVTVEIEKVAGVTSFSVFDPIQNLTIPLTPASEESVDAIVLVRDDMSLEFVFEGNVRIPLLANQIAYSGLVFQFSSPDVGLGGAAFGKIYGKLITGEKPPQIASLLTYLSPEESDFIEYWDPTLITDPSFSPLDLSPLAWYSSDPSTLYQDSAGETPVTDAGQDVGLRVDLSGNGNDAFQAIASARPKFQGDRLVYDNSNDSLRWTVPTGGLSGTFVQATTEGVTVGTYSRAAGTYQMPVFTIYSASVQNDVGQLYFDRVLTAGEISDLKAWLVANEGAGNGVYTGNWINRFNARSDITSLDFSGDDTSGVDNFSYTWYNCTKLTSFPLLDVSGGTNFTSAWYNCNSLTSFPLLDVSSGTTFSNTWQSCTSLTSFPLLDVSSGTNFFSAWYNCNSLTSFPMLDVSGGTNFSGTWYNCSSLTSFPLLDVSSGTNFINAWYGCTSLTAFPILDMSSGTGFSYTWQNCNGLTAFPLLDVSSGTNFSSTWRGCSSLTSFPALNVSNANIFTNTWQGCSGLTSFPVLDVSKGTNFSDTWQGCSGLTSFPVLDVGSGVGFNNTWKGCSSLTSFPALNVSKGTNFSNTWYGCTSLTAFPLLDMGKGTTFLYAWRDCSSLTSFPANVFDGCLGINFFGAFTNTNLTQTSIDNILVSINSNGTSNGSFGQSGGSAPSATGEAAIDALRARGWTVTVTGGY